MALVTKRGWPTISGVCRASLIAGLYVLAWAGPAFSESAWVLWKRVGLDESAQWFVHRAFPDPQRCHAALPRDSFLGGQSSGYALADDKPDGVTYIHRTEPRITLTCLPDTVDPRGLNMRDRR